MNTKIQNTHILIVKYLGQTNHNPSRIKIISERFKENITIPYESEHGIDSCEIAEHWLQENGFNIIGHAEGKDCYYVITDTFEPLKKIRAKDHLLA